MSPDPREAEATLADGDTRLETTEYDLSREFPEVPAGPPRPQGRAMSHKIITLALFDSEAAADAAAASLISSELAQHDAMGVLALGEDGKLKVDKLGARSTKKGAGIGAVLWLLGPV